MMTEEKVFGTVAAARGALALDTGFDPWVVGRIKGRCTKAKLAELGYVVDAREAAREAAERAKQHRCSVCQCLVDREYDGEKDEYPDTCEEHRKWNYQCDNGHKWSATEAEDKAANHKCPVCGEYWV